MRDASSAAAAGNVATPSLRWKELSLSLLSSSRLLPRIRKSADDTLMTLLPLGNGWMKSVHPSALTQVEIKL